jgi:hypothetical protein
MRARLTACLQYKDSESDAFMLLKLAPTIALEDLADAIQCGHVLERHEHRTNIVCAYDI